MNPNPNRDPIPQSLEQLEIMLENMKRSLREVLNDQEMYQRWKEIQIALLVRLIDKKEEEIRIRSRLQN